MEEQQKKYSVTLSFTCIGCGKSLEYSDTIDKDSIEDFCNKAVEIQCGVCGTANRYWCGNADETRMKSI